MAATVTPLRISDITASRRCDIRSVNTPPKNVDSTIGATVAAATRPAWPALPVVSSTNSGTASIVTMLPRLEIRFAASIQYTGAGMDGLVRPWVEIGGMWSPP